MNIRYSIGKKPQYKESRWRNYEWLRTEGFMKWEARNLSRITDPKSSIVLKEMRSARHRLVNKLLDTADANNWTDGKTRYEFSRAVRKFYRSHKLVNVAGLPDVWVFYHVAENKAAQRRGWKKGEYDRKDEAGESTSGVPSRRPDKKDYPKRPRGNIKAQKARASDRAGFYRRTEGKLKVGILEREYRDSFKLVADAKTTDTKRAMVNRQIGLKRRLERAQKTGAFYG